MSRVRLTIDSSLSQLFVVSVLVRGVCDHLKTDAVQSYSLELCAVEAVTNAIKHAYRGAPGHDVTLDVSFTRERLELLVLDHGLSMPQEQIVKLAQRCKIFDFDPESRESIPEGGMGLEIIRHEMDQAFYSSDGGVNSLKLTKFLSPLTSTESH